MKCLVIGGTGYLGKKIIDCALKSGHEIYCWLRRETSKDCFTNNQNAINFYEGGISGLTEFLIEEKIDTVVYAACVYENSNNQLSLIEANLELPVKVLTITCKSNVKKFIHIGTSLPGNVNLYALTKREVSKFGKYFASIYKDFAYYEVLLESFYGPDQPNDRFLSQCISRLSKNETLELTLGLQHRDYIHISDVVKALMILLENTDSGYHEYSLGSGEAPSIQELLNFLKEEMKSASELKFGAIQSRKYEPDCCADLKELNKLGFFPQYDWKTGMKDFAQYFRRKLE